MHYTDYPTSTLQNGSIIAYKRTESGTCYHMETPDEVVRVLENALKKGSRLRLFYGDAQTGQDWLEEHDVLGTIGRSTGSIKIPLLLNNTKSIGGGAILDHCVVKITSNKQVIYQHPNYHTGNISIGDSSKEAAEKGYTHAIFINEQTRANFKSADKASRYMSFLKGERNAK